MVHLSLLIPVSNELPEAARVFFGNVVQLDEPIRLRVS